MKTTERKVSATLDGAPYATRLRARGLEWISDEPLDHGGADRGPSAHEMLLGALAACTAITLRMYADRKGWEVKGITVHADLVRTQEGREVESRIQLNVELPGTMSAEQRERMLQIAAACPVHRTLQSPMHISIGSTG